MKCVCRILAIFVLLTVAGCTTESAQDSNSSQPSGNSEEEITAFFEKHIDVFEQVSDLCLNSAQVGFNYYVEPQEGENLYISNLPHVHEKDKVATYEFWDKLIPWIEELGVSCVSYNPEKPESVGFIFESISGCIIHCPEFLNQPEEALHNFYYFLLADGWYYTAYMGV